MQLLQTNRVQMITLIKICFAFFVFFIFLFFQVEFAVNPHLPGSSSLKLLPSPTNPQTFPKQVVLIIIDALREDYKNRFQFISHLMAKYPASTYLAKSKVGNPTMTTQRIESMMTGSEIFSSGNILKTFLASRVDYDNLVSQLNHNNKSAAIFGDNTWVKLFDFSHSEVCVNTFDVHDLDTCDRVVYDHLPQETFTEGQSNFSSNLIIAHILGVDHVGHSRSSIDVPILDVKIKEISVFLQKLFEAADDGVMFLVTGDHGMRSDGNHGGSSKQEVQTLMFGYLKGASLYQQNKRQFVAHCDMTSTLSILLDVPLPKNAIGYPILNLLPESLTSSHDINSINNNLYIHFQQMLSFYSMPLSVEQSLNYTSKLHRASDIQEQQILIDYLNQRLGFLKYSSPQTTTVVAIACILSLLVLSILLYIFWNQLVMGFTQCRGRLFLIVFCEGLPMFTLFISYLSWNIIQNLSDALVSGFIAALIFGVLFNLALRNKLEVVLKILIPFVILSQIQPDKSNDYKPSNLRLESLNAFLSTKTFWLTISSAEILLYLRLAVGEYLSLSSETSSRRQHLGLVKMIIATLSYLNYIFSNLLKNPIYEVSFIQTITLIGYTVILCLGQMSREERRLGDNLKFIVINFLSVFMGPHFPLILAVCMYIQRQISSCYNYTIMMSLLSKCVWWWLGNRYEYSGVDILKTYVYSSSYAIFLNGLSLVVYLNSPFILNFLLLNYRLLSMRPQIERYLTENNITQYHWEIVAADSQSSAVGEDQSISSIFMGYLQISNLKYAGVLMLGLVSSIWTTLFNNQKLLFTVVCVPVLVLISLITLSTLLMTLGLLSYFGGKVNNEYHKVELQT